MKTKTSLGVEQLDRRDMPSITLVGGVLTMNGGGNNDVASVAVVGGQVQARLHSFAPGASVGIGQTRNFDLIKVKEIVFNGGAGDDKFTNQTSITSTALGGAGKDLLRGGFGKDVLRGGIGDDTLNGRAGGDELRGGADKDKLYGSVGNDKLYGGAGADELYGNAGHDELHGEGDNDKLYGDWAGFTLAGAGVDELYGGAGTDVLDGGQEGLPDTLWGGNPEGDVFFAEVGLNEPKDATDPGDVVISVP